MSKKKPQQHRSGGGRQRRLSVRSVRRESPDLRKYSRALIALALEEAAAEAAAQADVETDGTASQADEPSAAAPESSDD